MKQLTLLFFLYLAGFSVARSRTSLDDVTYTRADSAEVVILLKKACKSKPKNALLFFANHFKGRPYVGGTLDRASEEHLVVNLHELDCTTYVEQVLALAMCAQRSETSFESFCSHLRSVRYVGGRVSYTNRQHYFTLWIDDNEKEGIVCEINTPNPPFTALQRVFVNYMTTHVSSYHMLSSHPEWLPEIRKMEKSLTGTTHRYIPKKAVKDSPLLRRTIHNGDILVMLTSKKGLDTSHIGFAVWQKDGLHLLHASSAHKKVVLEPRNFYRYQQIQTSQTGIRVVRMK